MQFESLVPKQLTDGAIAWVARYSMRAGDGWGSHVHDEVHQLAWSPVGVLNIDLGASVVVLSPSQALWIPAGTPHDVCCTRDAVLHSVYALADSCPVPFDRPTVVEIGSLSRELMSHLAASTLGGAERRRAEQVLFDQVRAVDMTGQSVPLPTDDRALLVARALLRDPSDERTLDEWGRHVGASGRTLARQFVGDTGLTFADWRTQIRIRTAIGMLDGRLSVATVARRVGYRNTSAFAATFRKIVGSSPSAYCGLTGSLVGLGSVAPAEVEPLVD